MFFCFNFTKSTHILYNIPIGRDINENTYM